MTLTAERVAPFAALVENTAPPSLRSLVEQAIAATDAASLALDRSWRRSTPASEAETDRAENIAWDARKRLADYLLTEHGITTALAKRMGEVLP